MFKWVCHSFFFYLHREKRLPYQSPPWPESLQDKGAAVNHPLSRFILINRSLHPANIFSHQYHTCAKYFIRFHLYYSQLLHRTCLYIKSDICLPMSVDFIQEFDLASNFTPCVLLCYFFFFFFFFLPFFIMF
ncbi:hypothetical protein I3760_03G140200 [Carya illinoinensis]|nr:hypothetical protein I3760_03G140200 [Carya illinoinensis]